VAYNPDIGGSRPTPADLPQLFEMLRMFVGKKSSSLPPYLMGQAKTKVKENY